jgi:Anthrone oxygenase
MHWRAGAGQVTRWIIAALALVLYAVAFLVTVAFNIPLNNDLADAGDPARVVDLAAVCDDRLCPNELPGLPAPGRLARRHESDRSALTGIRGTRTERTSSTRSVSQNSIRGEVVVGEAVRGLSDQTSARLVATASTSLGTSAAAEACIASATMRTLAVSSRTAE